MDTQERIIEEMKNVYLKHDMPWVVLFSSGKDSSYLLSCVWEMLRRNRNHFKPVYVLTVDTMVETPFMSGFVKKSVEAIQLQADKENLPIITKLIQPSIKNRYFSMMIGRGNPIPLVKIKQRYCTDRMKIKPTEETLKSIGPLSKFEDAPYNMVMLMGTREEESSRRKASIDSFSLDWKFGRHADYSNILVYHAIKDVMNDEVVFDFFLRTETLPWGIKMQELINQYGDNFAECNTTSDSTSCGTTASRLGCWTCSLSKPDDPMLLTLIDEGRDEYQYLLNWKKLLMAVRDDVRYRVFTQRSRRNKHLKTTWNYENSPSEELTLHQGHYENFPETAYEKYEPGAQSLNARYKLLEALLYTEEKFNERLIEKGLPPVTLIEEEEILSILNDWKETEFVEIDRSELKPKWWNYDGTLKMTKDKEVDLIQTTNPYPVFYVTLHTKESIHQLVAEQQSKLPNYIPCFFNQMDLPNLNLKWNTCKYIVCNEDINNQDEATQLVLNYVNWDKNRLIENLQLSTIAELAHYEPKKNMQKRFFHGLIFGHQPLPEKVDEWHLYDAAISIGVVTKYDKHSLKEALQMDKDSVFRYLNELRELDHTEDWQMAVDSTINAFTVLAKKQPNLAIEEDDQLVFAL